MIIPIVGRAYISNLGGTRVKVMHEGKMHCISPSGENRWVDAITYQDTMTGEVYTMGTKNFSERFKYENRDSKKVSHSVWLQSGSTPNYHIS